MFFGRADTIPYSSYSIDFEAIPEAIRDTEVVSFGMYVSRVFLANPRSLCLLLVGVAVGGGEDVLDVDGEEEGSSIDARRLKASYILGNRRLKGPRVLRAR